MKVKASWSKPEGKPGLIGRKKVDWSIFEYGTPIPIEFQEEFDRANRGNYLVRGERRPVYLLLEGNLYSKVSLTNMDRIGVKANTYHIRYDGNRKLRDHLKESLYDVYTFLKDNCRESESGKRKVYPSVPDEIAAFLDFYETEVPFRYLVEIVWANEEANLQHHKPVRSYDEVVKNVERFNEELPMSSLLTGKLKMFKHWYFIPEIGAFGPSKFIGYQDMSESVYREDLQDGGVTEGALKEWFDTLEPGTELDSLLKGDLNALLGLHNKSIKQNAHIHVPKGFTGVALDLERQRALSAFDEQDLEKKIQMPEEEFEKWVKSESGEASLDVRLGVKKIRRYQQSVIKRLKDQYATTCQLCGWSSLADYGVDISEAHHIEHFSKTMNNKPSNIVILCPSHHRVLHAIDATFDKEKKCFVSPKGITLPLKINKHL